MPPFDLLNARLLSLPTLFNGPVLATRKKKPESAHCEDQESANNEADHDAHPSR
jgi:hypothetical protein